jgi:hypothetical protein
MAENGGDIIIKGGSVELTFNDGIYQKGVSTDPSTYRNPDRQITRVVVVDEAGRVQLDSGASTGLLWRITVSSR